MDGDVVEVQGRVPRLHGLQVLYRLQPCARRLLVDLQHQRRDHDRDRTECHGRRSHPRLKLESPGGKDSSGDGDPAQVVDGREDEVQPDAAN